jgi:hypothetical protein
MLTRKNVPWKWTKEEEDAFKFFKEVPNQSTNLTLSGLFARVLYSHRCVRIAYASRHLNYVKKNWSTIEKEAYAIVKAEKQFYPYLYGRKF